MEKQTLKPEEELIEKPGVNLTNKNISTNETDANFSVAPIHATNSSNLSDSSNTTSSIVDEVWKGFSVLNTGQLLLLIDLILEMAGMLASVAVIIGLRKEKRNYLLPWIIVLPIHTTIDVVNYCTIAVVYLFNPQAQPQEAQWDVFPIQTVVPGLLFNCINVYAYVVIFSQFQEYCAGRGTAAYEALLWQNEANVHFSNANMASILQRQQQNHVRTRLNAECGAEQLTVQQRLRTEPGGGRRFSDEQRIGRRPSAQFCQKQLNRNQDKMHRRESGRESIELSEVGSDVGTRLCVRFDCEPSYSDSPSTQSQSQSSSSHCVSQALSSSGARGSGAKLDSISPPCGLRGILTNSPTAKSTKKFRGEVSVQVDCGSG